MSTQPGRENPNNDRTAGVNERSAETPCESVVLPPRKLVLLGELLCAAPKGLESADIEVFAQEIKPLLHASISDQIIANFCEAAKPFLASGAPVATTLKLCATLLEEGPPLEQLSQDVFGEILRAHAALLSAPAAVSERRAILPHLCAIALMRPGLAGRHAAQSIRALGEILLLAPRGESVGTDYHRVLRDLDPLLGLNAQFEDLTCLSALLRNEDRPAGAAHGYSYQAFCSVVPALRSEPGGPWGELRAATRAAIRAGFPNAWQLLRSYTMLRREHCSPAIQQTFLLAMGEIGRDSSVQDRLSELAADLALLWAALPPPDRACRDLARTITQGGAIGLRERLVRVTATGFEQGEPEMRHFAALAKLAGYQQVFSSVDPVPANVVRRIALLRSVADLSAGFSSALAFDLKRLPGQVFSPLVRSALTLGGVQLVHSDEFRTFPGHGILVTNFLHAAASAPARGPFSKLIEDSSLFAHKLADLPNVKLLCTPGLLIFSPPARMGLALQGTRERHFSLVVYSPDHRHPSLVRALLVDSAWVWERVAPCLKVWSPNWNTEFAPQPAVDLQDAGLRPEQILAQNRPGSPVALEIASPTVLIRGFGSALTDCCGDTPREGLGLEIGRFLTETLDLMTAWRIGLAHIHKGLANVPAWISDTSSGASADSSSAVNPGLDHRLTPLADLLSLHYALRSSGNSWAPTDPVLVSASAESYQDPSDGDIVIDARTLETRIHGLPQQLFEQGAPLLTPTVRRNWLDKILPRLKNAPAQDLRFIERRELPRV